MNKTIIPHKCRSCNCVLWFSDDSKNYVYKSKKSNYWYLCDDCK